MKLTFYQIFLSLCHLEEDKELSEALNNRDSTTWERGVSTRGRPHLPVPHDMEPFKTQGVDEKHMSTSGTLIMTQGSSTTPKPWDMHSSGKHDEK